MRSQNALNPILSDVVEQPDLGSVEGMNRTGGRKEEIIINMHKLKSLFEVKILRNTIQNDD